MMVDGFSDETFPYVSIAKYFIWEFFEISIENLPILKT